MGIEQNREIGREGQKVFVGDIQGVVKMERERER